MEILAKKSQPAGLYKIEFLRIFAVIPKRRLSLQHQTKSLRFPVFIFLLWMISFGIARADNPQKHCDSLIQAGIAKMRSNDFVESIGLLTRAQQIAEKKNFQKQLFLAKNYLEGRLPMPLSRPKPAITN